MNSKLLYGDCFSGMGCFSQALKQLGVNFEYKFACEIDPKCRTLLETNFNIGTIHKDIKDIKRLPYVHLMTLGFPCQAYSGVRSNKQEIPVETHPSFGLFNEGLRMVDLSKPKVVIFENVKGFTYKNNIGYLKSIVNKMESKGYKVHWESHDSKDDGTPIRRNRVWIVCTKDKTFVFPKPIPLTKTISQVLDFTLPIDKKFTNHAYLKTNVDKLDQTKYYIDNGQSTGLFTKYNQLPETTVSYCLISSSDLHLVKGKVFRSFTTNEYFELFGIIGYNFKELSKHQIRKVLGNGMNLFTLTRLIQSLDDQGFLNLTYIDNESSDSSDKDR